MERTDGHARHRVPERRTPSRSRPSRSRTCRRRSPMLQRSRTAGPGNCRSRINRRVRPQCHGDPRPARSPRRAMRRRRYPRNPRLRVRSLRPGHAQRPMPAGAAASGGTRRGAGPPWPKQRVRLHLRRRRPAAPQRPQRAAAEWRRRGRGTSQVPMATWTRPCPRTGSSMRPAGPARSAQPHPAGSRRQRRHRNTAPGASSGRYRSLRLYRAHALRAACSTAGSCVALRRSRLSRRLPAGVSRSPRPGCRRAAGGLPAAA